MKTIILYFVILAVHQEKSWTECNLKEVKSGKVYEYVPFCKGKYSVKDTAVLTFIDSADLEYFLSNIPPTETYINNK
jgi:hypothetical protein